MIEGRLPDPAEAPPSGDALACRLRTHPQRCATPEHRGSCGSRPLVRRALLTGSTASWDTRMTIESSPTPYELIGGEPVVRRIAGRF